MPSTAYQAFHYNIVDVDRLIEAHSLLSDGRQGKKSLGHITRSGVVMLCATWELYIESLLRECLDYMLDRIELASELPLPTRKFLSLQVKESKHQLKAMDLADSGWRQLLVDYADQHVEALNSPNPQNVDTLYKRYLGIENFSDSWSGNNQADLAAFIRKRGAIAHTGRNADYIKIRELENDRDVIALLAQEIDEYMLDFFIREYSNHYQPWRRRY